MQVVKIAGEGGDQITETSNALDVNIKSGSSGLPVGAATSALQTALNNLIGEVQASPTSNTLLDRIKQLQTVLSGSAYIGTTGMRQFQVSANFTRPADANAYAAGDSVANSTSAPTVLELDLTDEGADDAHDIIITKVEVAVGSKWATQPMFRLWIDNATFSIANDNAAFDVADAVNQDGRSIDVLNTSYSASNCRAQSDVLSEPFRLAAADKSIFAALEILNAPTPGSGDRIDVVIWGYLL